MKKLLSVILAACMMFAASAFAESAGSQLGYAMLAELYDGEHNCVISPLSLTEALALAARGAKGETQREILDALGIESPDEAPQLGRAAEELGIRRANAAFLAGDMVPNEDYVNALEEDFDARWFENSGDTAQAVNEWVKKSTDGMIEKLLEEGLPDDLQLVLVNALAMDAAWMQSFDPAETFDNEFHAADGDVTVPFMHQSVFAPEYGEKDGVQFLKLDYEAEGLTLRIALPAAGEMAKVVDGLRSEGTDYFVTDFDDRELELAMPKTDIECESQMKDGLMKNGIVQAFAKNADFSGISENPLRIDSVIQKTRLILDEDGTRAAAATAVMMVDAACDMPEEEIIEFTMDRPFAFSITDEQTGAVIFAGIVENPAAN